MDGHGRDKGTWLMAIGSHEQACGALTQVISTLVDEPVAEGGTSAIPTPLPFLATAAGGNLQASWPTTARASTSQISDLITAAGSIVAGGGLPPTSI